MGLDGRAYGLGGIGVRDGGFGWRTDLERMVLFIN